MDFPKSVAGIGLVGDRFIDENPVTGQQGSLIAAAWGNQVTDEILNVLTAAKIKPSEEQSDQLLTAIRSIITDNIPKSLSDWKDIDNKPLAISALTNIVTVSTTGTLTNEQLGVILIDASASDVALTLPQSALGNKATRVTLFRLDNSTHKVIVKSATGETIYFNTHLNTQGYGFFYLMGAGDYWQLMSDGSKGWYTLNQKDATAIGRLSFDTSLTAAVGGYLVSNGTLLNRSDYPWLWDYAQKSGALVAESEKIGHEGCFTSGDGATTFRTPNIQGAFLRALNAGSGIDATRTLGSYQEDAIRNITGSINSIGSFSIPFSDSNVSGAFGFKYVGRGNGVDGNWAQNVNTLLFDASKIVPVASENRPTNIAYPVYIKII